MSDLDKSIKDLLSVNETNKKKIEYILNNVNNDKIKYAFNLPFKEWIYIFTKEKKPTKEGIKFDGYFSFLKEILDRNKNEKNYFYNFIFCLYNFEIWFNLKEKKKSKRKTKKYN